MTRSIHDHVVGDPGEPAEEASRGLVGELVEFFKGAEEGLLKDVIDLDQSSELHREPVIDEHPQARAVLLEERREGLAVPLPDPFDPLKARSGRFQSFLHRLLHSTAAIKLTSRFFGLGVFAVASKGNHEGAKTQRNTKDELW